MPQTKTTSTISQINEALSRHPASRGVTPITAAGFPAELFAKKTTTTAPTLPTITDAATLAKAIATKNHSPELHAHIIKRAKALKLPLPASYSAPPFAKGMK